VGARALNMAKSVAAGATSILRSEVARFQRCLLLVMGCFREHTDSAPAMRQFAPPSPSRVPDATPNPCKGGFMNLTISGHHLEVTPALREYVLTKLDRVTRHFDQVVDISVLLSVEKLKEKERRQKAEVTLRVKGKDIFIEHAHEDLYAAIDQLMDKLDRQVCRHKEILQDHHHHSPKRVNAAPQ
jgi:putative sigma-54 modulation protein